LQEVRDSNERLNVRVYHGGEETSPGRETMDPIWEVNRFIRHQSQNNPELTCLQTGSEVGDIDYICNIVNIGDIVI